MLIVCAVTAFVATIAVAVSATPASAQWQAQSQTPPPLCVVNVSESSRLNMRLGPSLYFQVVAEVSPGTCDFTRRGPATNGWTPVELPGPLGPINGWVASYFVREAPSPGSLAFPGLLPPGFVPGEVCIAAEPSLNLRSGPGTHFRIVTSVPFGECHLLATGNVDGVWSEVVRSPDQGGHVGWMHSGYFVPSPSRFPSPPVQLPPQLCYW